MRNCACKIDSVRKETSVICILGLPWWLSGKESPAVQESQETGV